MSIDRPFFFDSVRNGLFGTMSQSQVDGCNSLLDAWSKGFSSLPFSYLAYALATAYHETARTMQPIEEYGKGKGKAYAPTFYGRGYVQLTWEANYKKAGDKLGFDLVGNPALALNPAIAAAIMFQGMESGWFTGKSFASYLPSDPLNARRIINGTDKAETIEGYYVAFSKALRASTPISVAAPVTVAANNSWFSKISSIFARKA